MSETIELRDYEQAQTNLALKEAQRGLVVHALIALLSVVVHALLVLRAHDVGAELFDDGPKPLRWLLGQLHNCTDILPGRIASALESSGEVRLGMRRSYGAAARQLRNWRAPDDPRGSRVP